MGLGSFLYEQLGRPSGRFGRLLLQFLNWANAPMIGLALTCLDAHSDDRVLEIGFGGGRLIGKLAKNGMPERFVGVERSAEAVAMCGARYQALVAQGRVDLRTTDTDALPFEDRRFNKVCSVNTLYFWSDPVAVLSECRRVLSPDGALFVCYKSKDMLDLWGWTQIGLRGYTVAETEALLVQSGFADVQTASAHSLRDGTFYCSCGRVC